MGPEEVVQRLLREYGATRGRTATPGSSSRYWERAQELRFRHDPIARWPSRHRADKPGRGRPFWIYVGKGNVVCCGDKPW